MTAPKQGEVIQGGPWDGFALISSYTDEQGVADGVLYNISGRLDPFSKRVIRGARATAGIVAKFSEINRQMFPEMSADGILENAILDARLTYRAMLRQPADEDGWRKTEGRANGDSIGEVWLVPNENGSMTLMLPEDY